MLRNYLKISARNLVKHKLHTIINTLSLSIGIASGLLILMFINEELNFDQFHSKSNQIYRIWMKEKYDGGREFINSVTPLVLASELRTNFPEVQAVTQYHPNSTIVRNGSESFNETVKIVGPDFFKIFDFNLVKGSTLSVFADQNDLVISDEMAIKYFGDNDPIGEVLELQLGDGYFPMTVKAVVEVPANSSIQFDLLISSLNNSKLYREGALKSWYNVMTETYVLTEASSSDLGAKFPAFVKKSLGERYEEGSYAFYLQPLTDIHLNTEIPAGNVPVSNPQYAYILGFIALFIILLGSINFITLSLGKSIYRAKEVGVRKVSGAFKSQLAAQFLSEALLISFISGLLGLILTWMALPIFNELADRQLVLAFSPFLLLVFGLLIIIIGLGAGFYPAIVLARFKPIAVLKGNVGIGQGKQRFRKGMVIVQFVISIFLLTSTLLMQRQLDYIQNRNLGFETESIITVPIDAPFKGGLFATLESAHQSAILLKQELDKNPGIISSGIAYQQFGDNNWIGIGFDDQLGNYKETNHTIVDFDLFETMGLEMVEGRAFDEDISSDANSAVIVNEAAVSYFGWDNPLEARFEGKRFEAHQIIGVVKDFNYQSLHGKVEPLVISINRELVLRGAEDVSFHSAVAPSLHLKVYGENINSVLDELQATWVKLFPLKPFAFDFVDQKLRAHYDQERSLRQIVTYSSILAIIIGALGLFGLVTLAVNGRIKEISIRKVLGASGNSIFYLLSKDYVLMILIALVLSIPFSVYFINNWLSEFEYRISLPVDVFLISGVVVAAISFLTISYNVIRATRTQPAESLKCE